MSEKEEPMRTLQVGDSLVTLLGTAHISRASVNKVMELLATGDYDAVAVELCPSRHNAIANPDVLAKMDMFQVLREGKAAMVAASLALGAYQQRLAEQFDIEPGAEMRAAIKVAGDAGLPVLLVDREIGITLKRVYQSVPWWQRMGLVGMLFASVVSREKVDEAEIERLKEGDILESAFSQFAEREQSLYRPLIDERDRYMSSRIRQELDKGAHRHLLVVIGAGHMNGIAQYLDKAGDIDSEAEIAELERLPAAGRLWKWLPWVIVVLILCGFAIGFSRSSELGWALVLDWVVINGGLAAVGAAIALAHPLTILTAFLAAPLTSLNPTVGAGMVTAAMETWLRKPKVADFTRLRQDTTHFKGWWRNKVTRVLLVFLLATMGSAMGTYIAGFRIFDRLVS